jgi:glycosyltransferase involved in cell wall biosynthesis
VPVVPIGTDPQRFRPLPEARAAARARWGYGPDEVVLLNVSALEARKGTRRALLALGRLRDRYPQLRYLILGRGDQEASLRALAHDLGLDDRVTFAGESPRLEEFYNLADVFVMLPDAEANSIACHEAMSCGLPVVVADRGGFCESVPPGAGLLVDPDCPEAIDGALAQLVESPGLRAQLGQAARANILAHHTWDQVAARFLEVVTCPSPS